MAVPFRRTSSAKKRKRRSHHALSKPTFVSCTNCGETKIPHRVCSACGFYKSKQVINKDS